MKVIYDKQTGTLLDATHVLIGDIDPYKQTTDEEMIIEVLAQDRPLLQKDAEVDKEREWAAIRTLFASSRLIDPEKVKADTKGNEPMDEESRLKTRATHKCPYCGEDVLEEGYAHCSAECLLGSTHNIADEIVEMATKDLPAIPRDKVDERADNMLHDPVNHPSHYTAYEGLEVIDLTEQMNFNRGNAVKYICRAGLKDLTTEIQDLEKAVWYLNREIARLKERT